MEADLAAKLRIKRLLQVRAQSRVHSANRRGIYQTLRRDSHSKAVEAARIEFGREVQRETQRKAVKLKESLLGVGRAHDLAGVEGEREKVRK